MEKNLEETSAAAKDYTENIKKDVDRANARMRHFRAVAASLLDEALKVWAEIWQTCQDTRTPDEIIDGASEPAFPACDRRKLMENLSLLRHYLDYTKRLCDGSI
jgi:hypothetical protein